jgi:glycosyltransferase involved in cell wall biosynthesis
MHVFPSGWKSALVLRLFRPSIDGVIAVSSYVQSQFADCLPRSIWTVIHNGIDTDRFTPDVSCERADDEPFSVVMVSRLAPDKHPEAAVEITKILREQYGLDVRLTFVGDGISASSLRELVRRSNIQDSVEFLGYQRDVRPFLRGRDGFLLLSDFEAFPLAPLEAAACGVPIFAWPIPGGIKEWLSDGHGGIISCDRTAKSLARRIADVLLRPSSQLSLRQSARQLALGFSRADMAAKTIEFYSTILGRQ